MTDELTLQKEAHHLAEQLFGKEPKRGNEFNSHLLDIYNRAKDKEFLIIHNPGGFGGKTLEECLQWEKNVVNGICNTIENLGYSWVLVQHFRAVGGRLGYARNLTELHYLSTIKINTLVAKIRFLTKHIVNLKVILIGVSQGAAFSNAVMQQLTEIPQVYSIELGMFFTYKPRRVIGERTLAIDNNGTMPDCTFQRNMKVISKTYLLAPFRWLKCRLQGRQKKFVCFIGIPGHDYDWSYPEVRRQVEKFFNSNFGQKIKQP